MQRQLTPEWMDDPAVDPAELKEALAFIRKVNLRLGGVKALTKHLDRWSANWPKGHEISILDIATGSADIPVEVVRWARERGHTVRITAVDIHETTLESAREYVQRELGEDAPIELVRADAKELVDRFGPLSFDYVHAGMFLHHLTEIEILTVLRIMDRLAVRGIVWNDLVRSRTAMAGIWALTLGQSDMIKHDARVSVRAGFTKKEVRNYARRTSLGYCRYRSSFLTQRFTLAGEKQGAWAIV
ncbi:MAG: methyltransferase domain-containing protein [Phycisphaerales bacterium]